MSPTDENCVVAMSASFQTGGAAKSHARKIAAAEVDHAVWKKIAAPMYRQPRTKGQKSGASDVS